MYETILIYLGIGIGVNLIIDLINDFLSFQEFKLEPLGRFSLLVLWPVFILVFAITLIIDLLK